MQIKYYLNAISQLHPDYVEGKMHKRNNWCSGCKKKQVLSKSIQHKLATVLNEMLIY